MVPGSGELRFQFLQTWRDPDSLRKESGRNGAKSRSLREICPGYLDCQGPAGDANRIRTIGVGIALRQVRSGLRSAPFSFRHISDPELASRGRRPNVEVSIMTITARCGLASNILRGERAGEALFCHVTEQLSGAVPRMPRNT